MLTFFPEPKEKSFEEADKLKKLMDAVREGSPEYQAARKELNDFLEKNSEMGPTRYQTYLNQQYSDTHNAMMKSFQAK